MAPEGETWVAARTWVTVIPGPRCGGGCQDREPEEGAVRPRPRASHRVVSRAVYQAHGLPRAQARHLVHAVGMPNSHLATTHVETVEAAGDPDGVGGAVLVGEDLGLHGSGRDNALDEGHCQHAWLVGEALGLWRDEDSADLGLGRLGGFR